jgi:outer membrane protein OmpA-like peptidoglycan-associated protein
MMLSEDRARAVKDYIESKGVAGDISVIGYGASHLVVPTGDEKQQAPNRRVEIYAYPSVDRVEHVDQP